MAQRRRKPQPGASESPKPSDAGLEVYPHELRAGDRVTDEAREWELLGHPSKVVGANDFTATMRCVASPPDTREGRWRAHERVQSRRPVKERGGPSNP
jgi:hypothetical protein